MREFVKALFGDHRGHVALAVKQPKWQEITFAYPAQLDEMLAFIASSTVKADVFMCPALRKTKSRSKGDGIHLRWLWADIDWDKVPEPRRALVRRRITDRATIVVKSGSGDNVHVYVRLDRYVTQAEFSVLNQGLRDYLHADDKHTDNSLLRPPGTVNHKPDAGGVRVDVWDHEQEIAVDDLMAIQTWQDVRIVDTTRAGDGTYDVVDVDHLRRGSLSRLIEMDSEEASGRFGSRHGAVYQVTTRLAKRGLTRDEIHTLMDDFPPGRDKEDEENGYSLHRDIDRVLVHQPTREAMDTELAGDVIAARIADDDDGEGAFTEVDDDDVDEAVHAKVLKRVEAMEVDRLAREYIAVRGFSAPPEETTILLGDRLAREATPRKYAIDRLAGYGHNVTITGQYKVGKTLFLGNLIYAIAHGSPFLGEYAPRPLGDGTVGMWSCEMDGDDLVDNYLRPMGYSEDAGVSTVVWNGRGYGVNILSDVGRTWAVNWLSSNDVVVWLVDSHARMCAMSGVDENDNGAVLGLLHRVDEIKAEANVDEVFWLAHTGRTEQEVGRERARGATALDDWADARWVLTRDGELRFLSVEGRGVDIIPPSSLTFDEDTKVIRWGGLSRASETGDAGVQLVVAIVGEMNGVLSKVSLTKVMRERMGGKSDLVLRELIDEAISCGFIETRRDGKRVNLWLTGDDKREGGATPAVLDLRERRRGGR